MAAYEDALSATSRPWAPWYAIPADSKPYMRLRVAGIIREQLAALDIDFPKLPPEELAELQTHRRDLTDES